MMFIFYLQFLGKCPPVTKYIDELELRIDLPLATAPLTVNKSVCGFTGKPIVTSTCAPTIDGKGEWDIVIEACNEGNITQTTKDLRNISLVCFLSTFIHISVKKELFL